MGLGTIIIAVIVCMWLWINVLAIACLFLDPELEPIQRWGQTFIAVLFPFIGATFILFLVNSHSPEVIDRFYIPWPLRKVILNKSIRTGGAGSNGEEVPGAHSGSFGGGSDGGGD